MYKPKGIIQASKILSKSTSFLVYYDPDIDGLISGLFIERFLTAYGKTYMYYINENREHGLKLNQEALAKLKGYTIIIVDAKVTKQEIEMLVNSDINVINIDHHDVDEDELIYVKNDKGYEGVVINNQYPFEPEEYRFLSGAGVIYYTLNCLSPNFCDGDEKALVGLTLLSDVRPLENPIARDFLHTTFTHKSPLINHLVEVTSSDMDFGFGVKTFDRNYIDYTFSPKINALFRLNKGYEAISIIQGKSKYKESLDVYKRLQSGITDDIIANLQGEDKENLTFKFVDNSLSLKYQYKISNFIGLACSRILDRGKTTILFVKEDNKILRGSLRGLYDGVDYLSLLRKHGFECEGHKNAFGITGVNFDTLDIDLLDKEIGEIERGLRGKKYEGRILDVPNLAFFLNSKNVNIADMNAYVRDSHRYYIKYTGQMEGVKVNKRGKRIEYMVDGIPILSFDGGLNIENGLILPLKERGYIKFYLRKY